MKRVIPHPMGQKASSATLETAPQHGRTSAQHLQVLINTSIIIQTWTAALGDMVRKQQYIFVLLYHQQKCTFHISCHAFLNANVP